MERFIDITVEKETPNFVLERLREIHPMAECLYIGNGKWWVGIVKPHAEARVIARKTLEKMRDSKTGAIDHHENPWPIVRRWLLQEQGFALCGKYRFGDEGPEWDAIIKDFEFADWVYRHWGSENPAIRAQLADAGVVEDEMRLRARAATVERLKADERYLFTRLVRQNPRPVTVGADIK